MIIELEVSTSNQFSDTEKPDPNGSVIAFESDDVPSVGDRVMVHHKGSTEVTAKSYTILNREFHVVPMHPMMRSSQGMNMNLDKIVCKVREVR